MKTVDEIMAELGKKAEPKHLYGIHPENVDFGWLPLFEVRGAFLQQEQEWKAEVDRLKAALRIELKIVEGMLEIEWLWPVPSTFLVDQTGMWEPTKDWSTRNGSEVEFYAKRMGRCGGGRT